MVCMMYWGTCGSGWRTAGMRVTRERCRMGARGRVGIVAGGCFAAVLGATDRRTCDPRTATWTPPETGSTTPASALPGHSPHESLPPYLGGPGGGSPLVGFTSPTGSKPAAGEPRGSKPSLRIRPPCHSGHPVIPAKAGIQTAGTRVTRERRLMGAHGRPGTVAGGCFAAVRGATGRRASGPRTASDTPAAAGTASSASASPGRLP